MAGKEPKEAKLRVDGGLSTRRACSKVAPNRQPHVPTLRPPDFRGPRHLKSHWIRVFIAAMRILNVLLALLIVSSSGASAGDPSEQWILFRRSEFVGYDPWVFTLWPKQVTYNTESYYRVKERRGNSVSVYISTTYWKKEDPNSYDPKKRRFWRWEASINCNTQEWSAKMNWAYAPRAVYGSGIKESFRSINTGLPMSLCQTDKSPENNPYPPLPSSDATTNLTTTRT